MTRVAAAIYNGDKLLHTEPDVQSNADEHGDLTIAGTKQAVIFARGFWTHVMIDIIEEE